MADFILDPGEVVVEKISRYWIDLVWPAIVAGLLVVATIFGLGLYARLSVPGGALEVIPPSIAFILAAALMVIAFLIVVAAVYVFLRNLYWKPEMADETVEVTAPRAWRKRFMPVFGERLRIEGDE